MSRETGTMKLKKVHKNVRKKVKYIEQFLSKKQLNSLECFVCKTGLRRHLTEIYKPAMRYILLHREASLTAASDARITSHAQNSTGWRCPSFRRCWSLLALLHDEEAHEQS